MTRGNYVQNAIMHFLSEHPGSTVSDINREMPEIGRSSISAAVIALCKHGNIERDQDEKGRYQYTIAAGVPVPDVQRDHEAILLVSVVSEKEWRHRYAQAEELLQRGLPRRANRVLLELLNVTAEAKSREKIIRLKALCQCDIRPVADPGMAGRLAGGVCL